jgi:hypothetical protein
MPTNVIKAVLCSAADIKERMSLQFETRFGHPRWGDFAQSQRFSAIPMPLVGQERLGPGTPLPFSRPCVMQWEQNLMNREIERQIEQAWEIERAGAVTYVSLREYGAFYGFFSRAGV